MRWTSKASSRFCSRNLSTSFRSSAIFSSFASEMATTGRRLRLSSSKRSLISGNTHSPFGSFRTKVLMLTPASRASVVLLH